MAASDKLIPTALTIANNLKGIEYSTKGFYRLPGKKTSKWQNLYVDAVNYFASIYAKEVKVADSNNTWDYRLIDGSVQKDVFTPDQNIHHLNLGMIVAISEAEWNELQIAISKTFNIVYPFDIASITALYSPTELTNFYNLMGVFNGGATPTLALTDANGTVLGTFAQGQIYADRWNTLKVPADAALGVTTPYLAPIYKPTTGTNYFYRFTGIRRWATPFEGYDLV